MAKFSASNGVGNVRGISLPSLSRDWIIGSIVRFPVGSEAESQLKLNVVRFSLTNHIWSCSGGTMTAPPEVLKVAPPLRKVIRFEHSPQWT